MFARLLALLILVQFPVAAWAAEPLTLTAADGVKLFGTYYPAAKPKAIILLFHQAGSSAGEYAEIAPRLVAAGYSALAIDQRSGGTLFGPNRTVAALGHSTDYSAAQADMVAALAWAGKSGRPVILWGSSYSAALVFRLAAAHPGKVAAVIAFSPGEYLGGGNPVARAATSVTVPIFVTSAKSTGEIAVARAILAASPAQLKRQYVPVTGGVHGSSTLLRARNPKGAEDGWASVMGFMASVAP